MEKTTRLLLLLLFVAILPKVARGDEKTDPARAATDKGLEWLAKSQGESGSWTPEKNKNVTRTLLTARAAMAILMQGSTISTGKYKTQIDKAVNFLVNRSQQSGAIYDPKDSDEAKHYMEGHGFAMLFLASVYSQETNEIERKTLKKVLASAVEFCGKAQTSRGGWGHLTAKDGEDWDFGEVTVTQMQGLGACLRAGVGDPKPIMDKAMKYLENCRPNDGLIVFSLRRLNGGKLEHGEPHLTVAAIVCSFSAEQFDTDLVKKLVKDCHYMLPSLSDEKRHLHDEFTRYYTAQFYHGLGDKGFERLFPKSLESERIVWGRQKKFYFEKLVASQAKDGSWSGLYGPVFETSVNLTALQLDSTTLPIYRGWGISKDEVTKLIKDLGDKDAGVRQQAVEGLSLAGDSKVPNLKESVEPLRGILAKDEEAKARLAAATALGKIALQADEVVPVLLKAAEDDADDEVKMAAIRALGGFGSHAKAALPWLEKSELALRRELVAAVRNKADTKLIDRKSQVIRIAISMIKEAVDREP